MTSRFVRAALGLALVSLNVSACGDAAGPQPLDAAGKAALSAALTNSGALSATPLAAFAAVLVNTLSTTGALSTTENANAFEAVGIEIIYDVTSGGDHVVGTFTGVVGWSGLNATSNSVDELVEAVVATNTSTPATGTAAITLATASPEGLAFYANRNAGGVYTTYIGTTGNVTISAADFSGTNTNCASGVTGVSCNVSSGTISGNFNFGSVGISNPALTYTQPATTFATIPAVKIQITVSQ